jgi:hypothetical protein
MTLSEPSVLSATVNNLSVPRAFQRNRELLRMELCSQSDKPDFKFIVRYRSINGSGGIMETLVAENSVFHNLPGLINKNCHHFALMMLKMIRKSKN